MSASIEHANEEKLQRAVALHRTGHLAQAGSLYEEILRSQPTHFNATFFLGLCHAQQNNAGLAARCFAKAIEINPAFPDAYFNRGLVLHSLGNFQQALEHFDEAIRLKPDHAKALFNRGVVLCVLKRYEEALRSFDQALSARPDYVEAHFNRANALVELKLLEEAVESYARAIRLKPDDAEAHFNRGIALVALRRFEEALQSYDRAIELQPDFSNAHCNRCIALGELGRFEEALQSCNRAIQLKPDYAEAYSNRANVLVAQKRFKEALQSYDRAIQLKPDYAEAYSNRGVALFKLKRFEDALQDCERAIQIKPGYLDAWFNAGNAYFELNCNAQAISYLQRVIEREPYNSRARIASGVMEVPILYREESEILRSRNGYRAKLRQLSDDFESGRLNGDLIKAITGDLLPFYLAYQGYCDRDLQTLYGPLVCKIVQREYPPAALPPPPAPGERVRVGFVSGFFRNHSNWRIPVKGWISQLDRERFQIFGYHVGAEQDDETTVAASLCDRFVHGLTTIEGWRKEILADAPHVLIYPGLLMDSPSLQLAAQRLAPVQCNSWGHPETSGMPTLDYFISSDLMEPQDAAKHYSETLVRLPNLSIYYATPSSQKVEKTRGDFGLRPDATIFWCGQSLYKYLPQFDYVFVDIAARVGHCQFVFLQYGGSQEVTRHFTERLARAFRQNGLNYAEHCVMLSRLSPEEFVGAIGQCDVILDSIGWSGCNSTFESLEHNLPVVTLEGSLMRGRHSAAILKMIGVVDTIATSIDEYISIAVRLAADPAARAAVSRRIADNKHRLYRDRNCISALEDFLDSVARQVPTVVA